jgi:hypothetical protein
MPLLILHTIVCHLLLEKMEKDGTSHELGHQLQSIPDTLAASFATS